MRKFKHLLAIVPLLFMMFSLSPVVNAQDGEALFKSNCAACHKPDKDGVGPALQGKKQAWVDAGEGDLLYEWVKNAPELIKSGKSELAIAAQDFSPTAMTIQVVNNDEIDAIFDYVENYTPPVPKEEGPVVDFYAQDRNQNKVDGWTADTNRQIFYLQVILMFVLIFAIFMVSKGIQGVADTQKNKGKGMMTLLALVGFMALSNSAMAFEVGMANEHYIEVSTTDNIIFFMVNVVLLGIFLYMKSVMNNMVNTYYPEIAEAKEAAVAAKKQSKVSNILTAAVPIEEEKSILLDHDYDGIQELDNHLPPWWLWSFYASIVFAFYWMITHHVLNSSPDTATAYEIEMVEADAAVAAYLERMGDQVDETTVTMMESESDLADGAKIYQQICATCHLDKGQGETGPNLTDEYWMSGNTIQDIFSLVKYGNKNGMPSQQDALSPRDMQKVSSYILTMPYAEGKEAQGEKIPKAGEVPAEEETVEDVEVEASDAGEESPEEEA